MRLASLGLPCIGLSLLFSACGEPAASDQAPVQSQAEKLSLGLDLSDEFRGLPGAAVALVDDQGVLWASGFGYADVEAKRRVTADTAFWLASVSKTVTGTALAHAEERGLLSLDTDVRALARRRAGIDIAAPFAGPISLRQLVSHTSPVRDAPFYACAYYLGSPGGRHETMLHALGEQFAPDLIAQGLVCDEGAPLDLGGFLRAYLSADGVYYSPDNFASEPGFAYSNVGAALAGYALELKTGVSLADYARTNLFAPLHMDHTSWQRRSFQPAEVATPYAWDQEQAKDRALPQYGLATWPDGALRSSALDMGRFLAMVMRGGELEGRRVLREATVARMLTPIVSTPDDSTAVFWDLTRDASGRTVIGHNGSDPGAATFMWYVPETRLGFVLLINEDIEHVAQVIDPALGDTLLEAAASLHARRRR